MIDIEAIRRIEEASFNAWPALNVLLYDGWLLRFANGYTKRANSVNGYYPGALPLDVKIDHCETLFAGQNLQPIFRLNPLINPDQLDPLLQAREYKRLDLTSVQMLDLELISPRLSPKATFLPGPNGINSWLRSFHEINPERRDEATHKQMLQNIVGASCFMLLIDNDEIVACGLAVADGEYSGLFDIVTAVEHQRKGYGLELTAALLAWGKAMKTRYAYLQVMTDNDPANKLYGKLGFQEIYRYWYRAAGDNRRKL